MIEDLRDRLTELGRQKAMKLLQEYGDKNCSECGHSNWAHGENGCGATKGSDNSCPCKQGKSNEEIIFGTKFES